MAKSIKTNFMFNTAYSVLNMVLPLITAPYLARVIGADGVGVYAYSFSIAQFFVLVAKLGLTNYGTREVAKSRDSQVELSKTFSNLFGLQCCTTLVVSLLYFGYVLIFAGEYQLIAAVFSIWVVGSFLDIDWFWFGLEDFKRVSLRNIAVKFLTVACIFILVKSAEDVPIYAVIMVLGYFFGYLSIWFGVRKVVRLDLGQFRRFGRHVGPCLLLLIPVLSLNVYRSMDKVMLGALGTMAMTGIFDNGEKLIYCLSGVIASFGSVMLPKMSHLVEEGDESKIREYVCVSIKLMTIMTTLMTFGLVALSDSLVLLLFGPEFEESALVLKMAAPILIAMGVGNVVRTQYVIPKKYDGVYVQSIFGGAVLNVLLNLILIPKFGVEGAVVGTLVAEFFVPAQQYVLLKERFDYGKAVLACVPYVLMGAFSCFVALLYQWLFGVTYYTFILQGAIGLLVFAPMAFLWAKKRDVDIYKFIIGFRR